MYNISLFVEDEAHEDFLTALLQRLADTYQVAVHILPYHARGGRGKVINALKKYQQELLRNREELPHLIIVGIDGNCKRPHAREREISRVLPGLTDFVISAIPEPHIERWLLLDSEAFKTVFGRGCLTPDRKCERDRYKRLLMNAIYEVGANPTLVGTQHVTNLVNAMNLQRLETRNDSLGQLLKALQTQFKKWQ